LNEAVAPVESAEPSVCVVMATHNGAAWLDAQLDSILAQEGVRVKILVSDDGSTDGTLALLKARAAADRRIEVLAHGGRFGSAAPNFFHLIRAVRLNPDFLYAFADQDDIWNRDKLRRHARILDTMQVAGVSSDVTAFWPNGRRMRVRKSFRQRRWDHLFEPPGPGCSFLVRPEVLSRCRVVLDNLAAEGIDPLPYHDWMIYVVARASGMRWWIDQESSLQYRQHDSNEVGANVGWAAMAHRARRVVRGEYRSLVRRAMEIALRCSQDGTKGTTRLGILEVLLQGRRRLRDAVIATLAMPGGVSIEASRVPATVKIGRPMTDHDEYFDYLRGRSRLGAVYRRQILYPRLARRIRGRLLDVGCGIGDMLAFRRNSVGVDINERTVEFCVGRGLDARSMKPDELPFEDASFESVLMDNVLEHIEDPAPLLADSLRVLESGGRLLVGVPGTRGWDSDPDHKVRYDERSLVLVIERNGFRHAETFHTPLWRSDWLDRHVRQYCIYAAFDKR
jgi:rhamnosyltransferase